VDGMEVAWTATYPELVIIVFDFQYVRPFFGTVDGADEVTFTDPRTARMQVKIQLDGVLHAGTGPFALAQDGSVRGTGFAGEDLRSYSMLITQVQPGRHTARAVAALGPDTYIDRDYTSDLFERAAQTSLYPGPAFGNRKLFVMRSPYGLSLGA